MAEYGKFSSQFHAANYWLLGRRNLVGIEIAVCGEGNAVIGLESGGTIFKVNKVNELAAEKVRRRHTTPAATLTHATASVNNARGIHI